MASENTEARRARVRSLWLKPDRHVAEILLEEGFGGAIRRTSDGRVTQLASMVRNVINDRKWWRKTWRSEKRATNEDIYESRGEHIAALDSLQDVGLEMLSDPTIKGTPKAQALQAVTRILEAKGKALGVAEVSAPEPEDNGGPMVPFVGVVLDMSNVAPDVRKRVSGKRRDDGDDD